MIDSLAKLSYILSKYFGLKGHVGQKERITAMRLSGDAVTGSCAWREGEGRSAGGHAYLVVLTIWHEEALRVFLLAGIAASQERPQEKPTHVVHPSRLFLSPKHGSRAPNPTLKSKPQAFNLRPCMFPFYTLQPGRLHEYVLQIRIT